MGSALRRPHNHQLRTAIVSANWRGCEGEDASNLPLCCAGELHWVKHGAMLKGKEKIKPVDGEAQVK